MMTHVLEMVVDGVIYFVKTIWGLQERRWACTFDAVTSAAVSVSVTFVFCFMSIHNHIQRLGRDGIFATE
jgi:hypothetical protein